LRSPRSAGHCTPCRLLARYSSLALTTYTTALGTLVTVPLAVQDIAGHSAHPVSLHLVACIVYLGSLGSAAGYVLWNHALGALPARTVGAYLYIRPVLTAALAATVLGERPTPATALSGLLIIAGALLSFT
jgi:drug/metabolite transporter (DMT)-like permease